MEVKRVPKPDLRTELIAGVTTFFTMAYIVVVNPSILSTEGTGMPFSGVLTATVVVCFVMTLLMGVYARLPFAVAPGMGLNAFFAFTIILIPLTFSITQGILWGFISHAGLYTIAGRGREVGPVMYALALVSVGLLLLERFA
jgi:xanthine/uracil/vitamin C permease (AzgA family)